MPSDKAELLEAPTSRSTDIDHQFQRGLITEDERYEQVVERLAADHRPRCRDAMMERPRPRTARSR